jgi:hypothetical protein
MLSRRLTATLAYKAADAVPKVLYLGYDMEEARAAFELGKDKGYFRIKVINSFDLSPLHRWQAEPVKV